MRNYGAYLKGRFQNAILGYVTKRSFSKRAILGRVTKRSGFKNAILRYLAKRPVLKSAILGGVTKNLWHSECRWFRLNLGPLVLTIWYLGEKPWESRRRM